MLFVGDEGQVRDQGLELDRRVEDLDRLEFDPEGEDLGPEFGRGGEDRFCVLIDLGGDLEAPGDRGREGGVLIDHLLPDIDEEGVAGVGLADLVDGAFRDAPEMFFDGDVGVCAVGDGEPAGHEMRFVRVLYITLRFRAWDIQGSLKALLLGHSQKILPVEDIDTIEKVYRAFEEIGDSLQDIRLKLSRNMISFLR